MKIFDWVQGKHNAKQSTMKPNSNLAYHKAQEPKKEEFNDWPHGLLAIGTFGNKDSIHLTSHTPLDPPPSQDLLQDENIEKNHHEFTKSLYHKHDNLIDDGQQRNGNVFVSRGSKDGRLDNTKSDITKRSFSFLLKKMLICRSGDVASSCLRDKIPESRMKKILKALLHRKIYPHTPTSPTYSSRKKYLENKHMTKTKIDRDEVNENPINGSKWVKTDSEYIVLEI